MDQYTIYRARKRRPYLWLATFLSSWILCACEGPTGPEGPQGSSGEAGERGLIGFQGPPGSDADVGDLEARIDSLETIIQLMQDAIADDQTVDSGSLDEEVQDTPEPINAELVGKIPGLASIEVINSLGSNFWLIGGAVNWDGDIEDDGIQPWWSLNDASGSLIFSSAVPSITVVNANIKFFAAESSFSSSKGSDDPFLDRDFLVYPGASDFYSSVRLPFEEFVDLVPDSAPRVRDHTIRIVVEVVLTQSDGQSFADRNSGEIAIAPESE